MEIIRTCRWFEETVDSESMGVGGGGGGNTCLFASLRLREEIFPLLFQ